jgi:hypothetical protein
VRPAVAAMASQTAGKTSTETSAVTPMAIVPRSVAWQATASNLVRTIATVSAVLGSFQ